MHPVFTMPISSLVKVNQSSSLGNIGRVDKRTVRLMVKSMLWLSCCSVFNYLTVHVPGSGDFQMSKIVVLQDPSPLDRGLGRGVSQYTGTKKSMNQKVQMLESQLVFMF
ncbi:hypothetical protein MKW98_026067 [Papaver atlanticum]|uniref:AARP2CN domain-containing protein n=1 Tax=Papaver atlanticum TaxID=357466 RepID=A0AAD4RYJ7_9MAGN|nr:hypothetical protein MKW98_026067 [Papaver atlanticum]